LHAGVQPVHEVLSAIKKFNTGEILKVTAPFIPAPLLDKSLSMGAKHWLKKNTEEEYLVFFAFKFSNKAVSENTFKSSSLGL